MSIDYKTLRQSLSGAVYPICPSFHENGDLDLDGTSEYAAALVRQGARALMVTAGTSRLNLMTADEAHAVNKAVVDGGKGATVMAANPITGSTKHVAAFAERSYKDGAKALMVFYPERYYGDADIVAYFKAIASASPMGLLLHEMAFRSGIPGTTDPIQFSVSLIRQLCELECFVGLKEESLAEGHRYQIAKNFRDRLAIIVAGGGMRTFLACNPWGVGSYLVGIGSLKPEIDQQFLAAIAAKDVSAALALIQKYEDPLFAEAVPMGWHRGLKGAMALLGYGKPYERAPMRTLDATERARLAALLASWGWLTA